MVRSLKNHIYLPKKHSLKEIEDFAYRIIKLDIIVAFSSLNNSKQN